jgi:hypothetical protein
MKNFKYIFPIFIIFIAKNIFCMEKMENSLIQQLDKNLSNQEYAEFTSKLQTQLDNGNMDIIDWLSKTKQTASIHFLYLCNQYLYKKAITPNIVLAQNEISEALKTIVLVLLRTQQDIACYEKVFGKTSKEYIAVQYMYNFFKADFSDNWKDIIKEMKQDGYLPDYKQLLKDISNLKQPLPSPALGTIAVTRFVGTISFQNPSKEIKIKFNNKELFSALREQWATNFLTQLDKLGNWEGFLKYLSGQN